MAGPKRILIADDDRVTVEVFAAALRAQHVRVVVAADAMQAVMYAIRETPDAIVLDIGMPGGTGLNALKKLRDNHKTNFIPILVLTGLTDPDLPAKVHELGAAFARKPMRPAELHPMLMELIERRAKLVEMVVEAMHGRTVEELLATLAEKGLDATEAEVNVVLNFLAGDGQAVETNGRWYVA